MGVCGGHRRGCGGRDYRVAHTNRGVGQSPGSTARGPGHGGDQEVGLLPRGISEAAITRGPTAMLCQRDSAVAHRSINLSPHPQVSEDVTFLAASATRRAWACLRPGCGFARAPLTMECASQVPAVRGGGAHESGAPARGSGEDRSPWRRAAGPVHADRGTARGAGAATEAEERVRDLVPGPRKPGIGRGPGAGCPRLANVSFPTCGRSYERSP